MSFSAKAGRLPARLAVGAFMLNSGLSFVDALTDRPSSSTAGRRHQGPG